MAPKAKLVAYNLLGGENLVEYQTTTNIIDALGNSAGGANTSVVDVFNMSFGNTGGRDFDMSRGPGKKVGLHPRNLVPGGTSFEENA